MSAEQAPRQAVNSHPTGKGGDIQLKDIRKKLPLRVLSQADWQHWTTNGYVIVRQAVSIAMKSRNIIFPRRAEVELRGT
jgi:transcription elongation factor GreA-like protein